MFFPIFASAIYANYIVIQLLRILIARCVFVATKTILPVFTGNDATFIFYFTMNKIEVLKFRVTPEEKAFLKKRAESLGYDNFSRFMIDAAAGNCAGSATERLKLLNIWFEAYQNTKIELSRMGSNLNQLAKYENSLALNGIAKVDMYNENIRIRRECIDLLEKIRAYNESVFKELKKIK